MFEQCQSSIQTFWLGAVGCRSRKPAQRLAALMCVVRSCAARHREVAASRSIKHTNANFAAVRRDSVSIAV